MTDRSSDFIAARDLLLEARTDRARAVRDFRWPSMPVFNWALDYFDMIARGNDRPALWVVAEDGGEQKVTYAELSARSNQRCQLAARPGRRAGRPHSADAAQRRRRLWETMLAAMKLGAVVIPATHAAGRDELRDRLERGGARLRHRRWPTVREVRRLTGATPASPSAVAPGRLDRVSRASRGARRVRRMARPVANDPLLLYFTSGTTAKPKLVLHTHAAIRWAICPPCTGRPAAGRRPFEHQLPGLGEACVEQRLRAVECRRDGVRLRLQRFDAAGACSTCHPLAGVTTLCAPPTVWRMLIREDLGVAGRDFAKLVGAGEPLNPEVIEQVDARGGSRFATATARRRRRRRSATRPASRSSPARMGRPLPGYASCCSMPTAARPTRARSRSRSIPAPARA